MGSSLWTYNVFISNLQQYNIMKYTFISDPEHGWLAVSLNELKKVNIPVSTFSYYDRRNDMVYLEEDIDAPRFMKAANITNEDIYEEYMEDCFIRSLRKINTSVYDNIDENWL